MRIVHSLKDKIASIVYSAIIATSIISMLLAIRFPLMEGHGEMKETVVKSIGSMPNSFNEGAWNLAIHLKKTAAETPVCEWTRTG